MIIDPSSPCLETLSFPLLASSSIKSRRRRLQIEHLSLISNEGGDPHMHPSLLSFFSTLTSISTLHISWNSLDWNVLQDDHRLALTRLISLKSLDELEIVASKNLPLGLLQRFNGTRIHLTFLGTFIHQITTRLPMRPSTSAVVTSWTTEYFGIYATLPE